GQAPVFWPNCHTFPPAPFFAAVLAAWGVYLLWLVKRSRVASDDMRRDSLSRMSRYDFSNPAVSSPELPAITASICKASRRHITTTRQYSSSIGTASGPKNSDDRHSTVSRQTVACSGVRVSGGSR